MDSTLILLQWLTASSGESKQQVLEERFTKKTGRNYCLAHNWWSRGGDGLPLIPCRESWCRLRAAESNTRLAREKQGALIVAIHLPTKHSPHQKWRGFLLLTQHVGGALNCISWSLDSDQKGRDCAALCNSLSAMFWRLNHDWDKKKLLDVSPG